MGKERKALGETFMKCSSKGVKTEELGNGGKWRCTAKNRVVNFPPEAQKLLGDALNIYLFKRLPDLKKKNP